MYNKNDSVSTPESQLKQTIPPAPESQQRPGCRFNLNFYEENKIVSKNNLSNTLELEVHTFYNVINSNVNTVDDT